MFTKFLSFLGKRFELLTFGFVFTAVIYVFVPIKYFTWHELPYPPEKIVKVFSVHMSDVIIETTSNKKFICNSYTEEQCWEEVSYNPLEMGTTLCALDDCPSSRIIQMVRAGIQAHSFGVIWFTYALHDDGTIYVKHTGYPYPDGILMGIFIGGFCAIMAYIGKRLFLGIITMFALLSFNAISGGLTATQTSTYGGLTPKVQR